MSSLRIAACAAALVVASSASAQSPSSSAAQFETREQLLAQIKIAEREKRTSEAWLLRSRLEKGDFQEGDRIIVLLESTARADTMVIRSGKVLQFPGMSDLSLEGVLRSELQQALRSHLARYLRNPEVRVTALLPLAILGNVAAPGFYYLPADMVLRDAIMRAGGPRDGDLNKAVIRRGGETVWNAADVRVALADGVSIDRLHLRAGDEVFVPAPRRFPLATVTAIVSSSVALLIALVQVTR